MYAQETVKPYSSAVPKGQQVEHMFNKIAHSYDELNHILSLGIDRKWRKSAIRYLQKHSNPSTILDIATGTGDLAILANRMLHPKQITGIDISEKMMEIGQKKINKLEMSDVIEFKKEDCTNLNFDSNSYDAIISAFALRNFENLDQCLSEMYRVLKPGGLIVVIDLCSPRRFPMKQIFWGYRRIVMPIIGHTISHDNHAYTYLPDSMDAIPQGEDMANYGRQNEVDIAFLMAHVEAAAKADTREYSIPLYVMPYKVAAATPPNVYFEDAEDLMKMADGKGGLICFPGEEMSAIVNRNKSYRSTVKK